MCLDRVEDMHLVREAGLLVTIQLELENCPGNSFDAIYQPVCIYRGHRSNELSMLLKRPPPHRYATAL